MSATITALPTTEKTLQARLDQMRSDLETLRRYLAGPCGRTVDGVPRCRGGEYNGHRHWTPWYDQNRGTIVKLNAILDGEFERSTWDEFAKTLDPWNV